MGLTWRDLASSAALVAMIMAYVALEFRSGPVLLSSAWATSAELVGGGDVLDFEAAKSRRCRRLATNQQDP